jgi:pyridoxal phosphate enzyme (YggS family)
MTDNLSIITERMAAAAKACGRSPQEVRLVAVSKGQSVAAMEQMARRGPIIYGESYLREAESKLASLGSRAQIEWHFIGHLQGNKAARVAALFSVVQSVDSARLAERLNAQAGLAGKNLEILIQVNLANETAKSGCRPEETAALARHIAALPHLTLKGLMTLPPLGPPRGSRPWFAALRELRERLAPDLPAGSMSELSMGMSDDFEDAIAEGATMVRVGTALFGPRGY